jgi:hypothetical protein
MQGQVIGEGGERSICGLSLPEKDTDLRLFWWWRKVICNYTEKVGDLAPHNLTKIKFFPFSFLLFTCHTVVYHSQKYRDWW